MKELRPEKLSEEDILRVRGLGRKVLEEEGQAVLALSNKLDERFSQAIDLLMNCRGKVIVSGVGKFSHVGRKIAASLASLGTPSFFAHADETLHGDSGMIESKDVVIVITHSGETQETLAFLKILKKIECKIISITGSSNCSLAKEADVALTTNVDREADPTNLAPTTSSTVTLVLGDALAICLAQLKGFSKRDFALFHSGGAFGELLSRKSH